MCGIAGIVQLADCGEVYPSALQRMRDALKHRGPDDDGIWTSKNRRVESLACPDGMALQSQVSLSELSGCVHDQVLRDTDPTSMAHTLQVRVPLIGRRVVEVVAGLGHRALAGDRSKALLRRIVAKYLPEDSFRGAKQGFTLILVDLLVAKRDSARAPKSGLFREARVERIWKQFRGHRASFGPAFAVGAIESFGRDLATPSSLVSCQS